MQITNYNMDIIFYSITIKVSWHRHHWYWQEVEFRVKIEAKHLEMLEFSIIVGKSIEYNIRIAQSMLALAELTTPIASIGVVFMFP